jgi:putative endonuclease
MLKITFKTLRTLAQSITANTGNTHSSEVNNPWYLYLIENKLGQLYTGITTDPTRRIAQHRGELKGGAKALKGKSPLTFRAIFEVENKSQAAKLEAYVKSLSRAQKDKVIARSMLNDLPCIKSKFLTKPP